MKCAALSAPSASIDPAITSGWFATTATGMAAEPAQRADHRTTEVGLHLEARARVEHDVEHLAHVVDAPTVARHDVEHLGNEARRDVVAVAPSGGYDHADDGK